MPKLLGVYPISGEDVSALPVKSLEGAARFYSNVLGFSLVQSDSESAQFARDAVRIGLKTEADHDPSKEGSLAIQVDDLEGMHEELKRAGGEPGEFGEDEWGGGRHKTFFLREDVDGYCYCFFRSV